MKTRPPSILSLAACHKVPTEEVRLVFDACTDQFKPSRANDRFIRTIPFAWLHRANRLPGRTASVAVSLWFVAGVKKSMTFKLTAEAVDLSGCGRKLLYRALHSLEQARLIGVTRRQGARPVITIFNVPHVDRPHEEIQTSPPSGDFHGI